MALKFNIVITVFKTCKRKISILNTKYYESPFENFRVRKNNITITKVSKNNSNKSNNEYYNLESTLQNHAIQRKLYSAQRLVALRIVSAYRTSSTSAVLVLASVPPIDLLAEETQDTF